MRYFVRGNDGNLMEPIIGTIGWCPPSCNGCGICAELEITKQV